MKNTSSCFALDRVVVAVLTVVFVALKLTHVIEWPWVWVLSPLLIWIAIIMCMFAALGILFFVKEVTKNQEK